MKTPSRTYKIYDLLRKYLLITVFLVGAFCMLGFAWISYEAMQNDLAFMSAQENKNFAKILTPSLKISDTMEIDRILSLASSDNRFIAVIDQNHDILLSNYNNFNLVRQVIGSHAPTSCKDVTDGTIKSSTGYYYVSCMALSGDESLGLLINFSQYNLLPFSKQIIFSSIGLLLLALIMTIYCSNTKQKRR